MSSSENVPLVAVNMDRDGVLFAYLASAPNSSSILNAYEVGVECASFRILTYLFQSSIAFPVHFPECIGGCS